MSSAEWGGSDPAAPVLEIRAATVVRGGRRILDRVSAVLPRGAATAVAGASGSGKSTLLRLLNRLEEPDEGAVLIDGGDARRLDVLELRRRVGLLAQRPVMLRGDIAAEVRVGRPDLADADVEALLHRVRLSGFELSRATEGLSGGEQQRLALARALAVEPEVLLLDEPTSALDEESAQAVDEVVASLVGSGLTAVIVSHDLRRLAGLAAHAIVLEGGRIVEQGPPRALHYLRGRGGR